MLNLNRRRNCRALSHRTTPPKKRKLRVETLESRRVLATILWDGGAGTQSWHDAANWDGDVLPGASDDVVIDVANAGTIQVTSNVSVNSIDSQTAPLNISGGTFLVSSDSSIAQKLTINGGSWAGAGDVTLNDFDWISGTMQGTGTTFVDGTGEIRSTGVNTNIYLARTLENRGTLSFATRQFAFGRAGSSEVGTLVNNLGATLTVGNSAIGFSTDAAHSIINEGLLVYAEGNWVGYRINSPLDNRGTIRVEGGQLVLDTSFTNSGAIELTGGPMHLSTGQSYFNAGTSVSGDQFLKVNGVLTFNDTVVVPNLELTGTINGAGDAIVSTHLDWISGEMSGDGTTVVEGTGQIRLTAANQRRELLRTLDNRGDLSLQADLSLEQTLSDDAGRLVNSAGAKLRIRKAAIFATNNLAHEVINAGLLIYEEGNFPNYRIQTAMTNRGTIRVEGGQLVLATDSFTNGGAIELTGGTMLLSTGRSYFNAGTSVSGDRSLKVNGTLTFNDTTVVPNVELTGTINGPGNAIVDTLTWLSGTMSGGGTTTVNKSLQISGNEALRLDGRTLINAGTALVDKRASNWSFESFEMLGGAVIQNLEGATWMFDSISSSGPVSFIGSANDSFENHGSLVHSSAGTTHLGPRLINFGNVQVESGSFNFQRSTTNSGLIENDGGLLSLNGLTHLPGAQINASSGTIDLNGNLGLPNVSGLETNPNTRLSVTGSLVGDNQAEVLMQLNGQLLLDGNGTISAPQRIEVMGRDLGPTIGGFDENFSFSDVRLSSTYVTLQDSFDNVSGAEPEALYVDSLLVDSASTLDLAGLPLYVRQASIDGTVIGEVTVVGDSGPLVMGSNNPGTISQVGEIDEWTFFGRADSAVTIIADPGSSGSFGVVPEYAGGIRVTVIAPDGSEVIADESATLGQRVTLAGVALDQTGTYRVRIEANGFAALGVGNYSLAAHEANVDTRRLVLNQRELGSLETRYSVDRWTFNAAENDQIRFDLLAKGVRGLHFDLTGPEGWIGFTGQTDDSGLLTIPATGQYTLEAKSDGVDDGEFAFEVQQTSSIDLILGQATAGVLPESGAATLYRFEVPAAGPIEIQLADLQSSNRNEIYVGYGTPPNRRSFDFRSIDPAADQQLDIPYANTGSWYVLVYGQAITPNSDYTITASTAEVRLDRIVPGSSLQLPSVYVTLEGLGFLPGTTVELVDPSTSVATMADSVSILDPRRIAAEFDLSDLAAKTYDVRTTLPDQSSRLLAGAFEVFTDASDSFEADLIIPDRFNMFGGGRMFVEYSNTGDVPIPAPILTVEPANPDNAYPALMTLDTSVFRSHFWSATESDGLAQSVRIYAQGESPGILQPGEQIRIPIYYRAVGDPNGRDTTLTLRVREAGDSEAVDWSSYIAEAKPETLADDAWSAITTNLISLLGNTWGDYIDTLSRNASYLDRIGQSTIDVDRLFEFVYRQADGLGVAPVLATAVDASVPAAGIGLSYGRSFGNTITQRYTIGPFGRGWQTTEQATVQVDDDGVVRVIEPGGSVRSFEPDQRYADRFLTGPQETGTLRPIGNGGYQLIEVTGLWRQFSNDGMLEVIEDTNGNRLSYGYSNDLLTSLSHSSGESITIAYNAAGRIESVTDSSGWETNYTYDLSNELLLTATSPAGVITYSYVAGQGLPSEFALASIEDATGVVQSFEYDTLGRLSATFLGADESRVEYSYDQTGQVTTTSEANSQLISSYGQEGGIARLEDLTGAYQIYEYDEAGNLILTTDSFGTTEQQDWSRSRQLLSFSDQLRGEVSFASGGPYNQPLSFTDTRGNTIRYQYDSSGNLLGRIFPDQTVERFDYDDEGNLIATTNRRNQEIVRTVNEHGQLTREEYPDGSANVYSYDVNNRLESVDNRGAVTTYSYDSADRVTRIDYPKSRWIEYRYDAAGRRTRLEDHTGHVVQYVYGDFGRLSELLDAADALIVSYEYDVAGRLSLETHGNGTTSSYVYDSAGRIETLLNEQADGTDNSRFDYSYDTLGRRVGMTTLDGTWTYAYDATGQLILAVFDSTNPQIGDQDLVYEYDSAGNRIRTIRNGEETSYITNNLNQIVSAGDSSYRYDLDGNLIQESGSEGTKSYTYDIQNRLIRVVTPDGVWEYEYDAFGNRIASIADGIRTDYLLDPIGIGNVIGIYDSSNSRTSSYTHGLGLESLENASSRSYFDFDPMGSTVGLSSEDGTYLNRYAYRPFGGSLFATEEIGNSSRFEGRFGLLLDDNGMYFVRARYYAADTGRFISSDPTRLLAGDQNFYRYAVNNPISVIDVNGLWSIEVSGFLATGGGLGISLQIGFQGYTPCGASSSILTGAGIGYGAGIGGNTATPGVDGKNHWDHGIGTTGSAGPVGAGHSYSGPIGGVGEHNVGASIGVGLGGLSGYTYGGTASTGLCDRGGNNNFPGIPGLPIPPGVPPLPGSGLPDFPLVDPPVSGRSVENERVPLFRPSDPNEKIPLVGFGDEGFISLDEAIPYRVKFENLGPGSEPTPSRPATAPAQRVVITDQLSEDLDWTTLQFTQYGFGDYQIVLDRPSQYHFETLNVEIGGEAFDVEVELLFDAYNGIVVATLQSIDPEFGLPPFGLTGLLPPEDGNGIGQGFVEFVVQPDSDLPTGTEIRNIAEIRFDGAEIIATNQVDPLDPSQGTDPDLEALVTIDADAPESAIAPAATTTGGGEILLVWSGQDGAEESGIRDYTIYVSEGGAEPTIWLDRTTETQGTFPIELDKVYSFYSVATDNAGNVESEPNVFDLNVVGGPAPTVEEVILNGGDSQRSTVTQATVVFDRVVAIDSSGEFPFEIVNVDTDQVVSAAHVVGTANNKTVVDFTFLPGPSVSAGGSLVDGNYQLRIRSPQIVGDGLVMDGDGNGAAGDDFLFGGSPNDSFFRFFGDHDGDRDVDFSDLADFGRSFLKTIADEDFDAAFDFDGDGDVDGQDQLTFWKNMTRRI